MTQELNLLVEAINNGEAEGEGIKFIVMDENTIYRFENNKMKKVSATLLKRAKKIIQDSDKPAAQPKPKRTTKAKKAVDVEEEEQEPEDIDNVDEPEEVIKPIKPKRTTKTATPKKPVNPAYEIDLNEYWHTKNKLEFMELENTRLNNKVSKLKQYKGVLNKLMGSEYEPAPTLISSSQVSQVSQPVNESSKKYNDSLFMF